MVALDVGTIDGTPAPAALIAEKFNRHTFWCGQSGSGKTYALGVVLEELLLRTALPLVGGFAPVDAVVKVRDRYTHEGGADVRVPVRG